MKESSRGPHRSGAGFQTITRKGLPYLDSVYFKIIPEASTEIAALRKKEDRHDPGDDSRDLFAGRTLTGVDAMECRRNIHITIINAPSTSPFN